MSKVARFVIWICSKFTRNEIEHIINGLLDVLNNRNPEVKPKDDFKEKHPNYRAFSVDPLPPLSEPPQPKQSVHQKDYKELLQKHLSTYGKPLMPVKHRPNSTKIPSEVKCPLCNAPHDYIYYNDGNKRSQLKCKLCNHLFQLNQRFRKNDKSKYFCPYCHHALFKWKQRKEVTIYKCCNDNCPHRIQSLNKLNPSERLIQRKLSSQFKLCYQYREYHYKPNELQHSKPDKSNVDLTKIHNNPNILGLILTFYVSFAITARKTALILRSVFNINVSYQTVLNYAAAASFYCHSFNLKYKGTIDSISAGDEAYIKVLGKYHYVFFFISSKSLKITAYHVADNRGVQPAVTAMNEAIRTAKPQQKIILITDGNPSYPAGIHFINSISDINPSIEHHKVIGLQNLDKESEDFRPFKQLIERLNRTYKYHVKPSHGFNAVNGAVALTTLFVTHYNFLRPHMSLNYKTPVHLPELQNISTIQGKWTKILSLAA
ncbi:MAG: DDE-type integrase/transposase/recombinase [Candidatus Bathyarchaeota archaeon]|nr:DDE-type integrase/transposase/recombinase [Candidatus Bathyarchaeota archaeon]